MERCPNRWTPSSPKCVTCCSTRRSPGRSRPAGGAAHPVGEPRRAAAGRPQGRHRGCRSSPTTAPGRTPGTCPPARRPRRRSTRCWPSRSATGTWRRAAATVQVRVTKKGDAQVHRAAATPPCRATATRAAGTAAAARPRQAVAARPGRSAVRGDRRQRRRSAARSTRSCGRWPRPCRPIRPTAVAAARRRPGLRQRLPDLRRLPLPGRPRRARSRSWASTCGRTSGYATPPSPRELGCAGRRDGSWPARSRTRTSTFDAGPGAGAARLRHRDRSGAGPGGAVERTVGARRAVLPPRHRRPAQGRTRPRRRTAS